MKYVVIGGTPYKMYTGTTTFTNLKVVGVASSLEEANTIVKNHYDDCGGLLMIIDSFGQEIM